LKDAVGVIEALDSMTPRKPGVWNRSFAALRDLLNLKLSSCPACGKRRKLTGVFAAW